MIFVYINEQILASISGRGTFFKVEGTSARKNHYGKFL